ncbi:MAG: hypothetical protein AMS15_02730 [Planctomycetes bacterium DG_23]|nr:MAG: hypothetical protein AMS15_02730 [Planctomycetes bacterium DG_23]
MRVKPSEVGRLPALRAGPYGPSAVRRRAWAVLRILPFVPRRRVEGRMLSIRRVGLVCQIFRIQFIIPSPMG